MRDALQKVTERKDETQCRSLASNLGLPFHALLTLLAYVCALGEIRKEE